MPLTPEQTKLITRKITQWLENDRQIVTFRQVSREVGCHVDLAKNVLLAHARANPSLQITYLLSGPLLSTSSLAQTQLPSDSLQLDAKALAQLEASQKVKIRDMDEVSDGERNSDDGTEEDDELIGNDKGGEGGISGKGTELQLPESDYVMKPEQTPRWGVVMAQQEQFEVKRKLFESEGLSIHIYALSPGPITDPAQYLVPNTLLRQYSKYNDIKYGGISGDFAAEGSGSSSSKPLKDGGMDFGSKVPAGGSKKSDVPATKKVAEKDVKGKATTAAGKVKKEEEVKVEEKPVIKSAKAKEVKTETKPKETAKPTAKAKIATSTTSSSRKPSTQSSTQRSKKRIITSDDESEPGQNPPTDSADEPALASPAAAAKASTSSMVRADDQAAMEAMMDMDMSDDEDFQISKKDSKKKAPAVAVKKEGVAVKGKSSGERKRRIVKKSKTEMDEKGYMVTRDYTSEESYSGDSDAGPSTTKSKAKPAAKSRKSATSGSSANLAARSQSQSRASSVSTDINDEKETKKGGSSAAVGSSTSVGSTTNAPSAKPKPAPMPPKNVPGKAGKPKGQSTLAGFFTKK